MITSNSNTISSQPLTPGGDFHDMTRNDSVRGRIDDHRYLLLWVIMGMGTLLPFNAVINCVDYFDFLYPGEFIESKIAAAFNGSVSVSSLITKSAVAKTALYSFCVSCSFTLQQYFSFR